MKITKPALFFYFIAPKNGPVKGPLNHLRRLWEACRMPLADRGLGLSSPIAEMFGSSEFPSAWSTPSVWLNVLASAERPLKSQSQFFSAYLFEYLDALGMSVGLAPNHDSASWRDVFEQWKESRLATGSPPGTFGEALVFYSLYTDKGTPEELFSVVERGMREIPGAQVQAQSVHAADGGVFLWDAGMIAGTRSLMLVAPVDHDEAGMQLAYWRDEKTLADLPRFVLHAGKLNYELEVYNRDIAAIRAEEQRVEATLNRVLALQQEIAEGTHLTAAELAAAQGQLAHYQAAATGLIVGQTRIRELRRTVRIATENLAKAVPKFAGGALAPETSFFRTPLNQGRWLARQATADIDYIAALRERISEVYRITQLRMEEARARQERRKMKMDVTQTMLLASLGTCLGAMHAFHTEFPLRDVYQWPMIAFLMALAFALPLLLMNWWERYGWLEYVGGVFLGVTCAWLTLTRLKPTLESVGHVGLWNAGIGAAITAVFLLMIWGADKLQIRALKKRNAGVTSATW
jgi:hypothetical protein